MTTDEITISKELEKLIVPLSEDEYSQLEKNIIEEGCRDPLIVWRYNDKEILVDGHNRLKVCKLHDISFNVITKKFKNLDQVKTWIINNQLGRRNLTKDQMSYYRGLKYESLKKQKGGYDKVTSKGQNGPLTTEKLSKEFNVSERTIKRDSKFAQGLELIGKKNPNLKAKILSGQVKINKNDVQVLTDFDPTKTLIIKNPADLHNKAKAIREEKLNRTQSQEEKIRNDRIEKAREQLRESEPVFISREDRVNNIKGEIISAINRVIRNRSIEAVEEMRSLTNKLILELGIS